MVLAGNKAKHLSSVNHTTNTIHQSKSSDLTSATWLRALYIKETALSRVPLSRLFPFLIRSD